MKKHVITVVVLFLTLLSVVSAEEAGTLSVKIRSTVGIVRPIFQFEFTSGMEDEKQVTAVTAGEQGVDQEATTPPVVFVPDIKVNDLSLTFTAKLANEAKCYGSYTLTFLAGNFDVVRDGVSGVLAPSNSELKLADDFVARVGVEANELQSNSLQLSFNGGRCTSGSLAVFEVNYEADSELDPATYYADISLEVASNF